MKKLISAFLSVVMILSLGISSLAEDSSSNTSYVQDASELFSLYADDLDYLSPELGQKIPSYTFENDSLSEYTEANYYPIFSGDDIIAIFTINSAGKDNETYSVGQEFAERLNKFYQNNPRFILVWSGASLYAKSEEDAQKIGDYSWILSPNSSSIDDIQNIMYDEWNYFDSKNKTSLNMVTTRGAGGKKTVKGTIKVLQGRRPICWAACMATCINNQKGDVYSLDEIIENTSKEDRGARRSEVKKWFKDVYGISSTSKSGAPTNKTIYSSIDKNNVVYTDLQSSSHTGHAVVIYGYKDGSSGMLIQVMNPGTGFTTYKRSSKNGDFAISYNNKTWEISGVLTF